MDIKKLEYFIAVAQEQQITKAARKMYIAQPALSRQISLLEKELGTSLFIREGRKLKLTEAGHILYNQGTLILQEIDNTVLKLQALRDDVSGTLALGTLVACIPLFSAQLEHYSANFPNVSFKICEGNPTYLIQLLKTRTVELLFLMTPTFEPDNLSVAHIGTNEYAFGISPKIDPFPDKDVVSLKEIKSIPLVLIQTGQDGGYNKRIIHEIESVSSGFEPSIICQCSTFASALMFVSQGIGATICPMELLASYPEQKINIKKIQDLKLTTNIALVWDSSYHLSNAAKEMMKLFNVESKINP